MHPDTFRRTCPNRTESGIIIKRVYSGMGIITCETNIHGAFIRDPDGYEVEVLQK